MVKTGFQLEGDWDMASRLVTSVVTPQKIDELGEFILEAESKFAASEIRRGLRTGSPGGRSLAPLSAATLTVRRAMGIASTKPLVATGTLLRSVTHKRVGHLHHWAGFPNMQVRGRNPAQIMALNEFGATRVLRVTSRMRGFLGAVLGGAPRVGARIVVRLPPRPVLGPIQEDKFTPGSARSRVKRRVTLWMKQNGV